MPEMPEKFTGLFYSATLKKMFWIGIIIGLFLGANVGVVIAGMLFSAKTRHDVPNRAENTDRIDTMAGDSERIKKKSYLELQKSGEVQNESSNR